MKRKCCKVNVFFHIYFRNAKIDDLKKTFPKMKTTTIKTNNENNHIVEKKFFNSPKELLE